MSGFVILNEDLDLYHQQRADKHGRLYKLVRRFGTADILLEARSVATGVVCTIDSRFTEKLSDAVQEQS
jgi:hypothetical protein